MSEGHSLTAQSIDTAIANLSHNIIEFDEDKKSRRFRAQVSDAAIESVSQPLAFFLGSRLGSQSKQRHENNSADITEGQLILPDGVKIPNGKVNHNDNAPQPLGNEKALAPSTDLEVLRRTFRVTEDKKLKLSDSRLKQSNQSDFVKRLTSLFLYAHELEGRESVSRTDLNETLSDAKVYDGNARHWIVNTDFLERDGDSVRLARPGRDHAQKVLQEYLDPSLETKWPLGSKARTRQSKKSDKEASEDEAPDKAPRGRRPKGSSYTAKVTALLDEKFFAVARTGKEVKGELDRQGFKFESGRITEALVKLTKNKKLARNQIDSGEWAYRNS